MIPYSLNPLGVDVYDDLYWLRKIRDANPTSQLPSLWLDSEDPYTQWEGVTWSGEKVTYLDLVSKNIINVPNVNKLKLLQYLVCQNNQITSLDCSGITTLIGLNCFNNQLTSLNVTGLISLNALGCNNNQLTSLNLVGLNLLTDLQCSDNQLTSLDVTGLTILQYLNCTNNKLVSIPSLVSRQSIINGNAHFYNNKFNSTEVNRLLSIGFTAAEIGTQNP